MNDAELDQLIAAAATVSDAEVVAWDLAAPEAHLREEIMSTTDSSVPAGPGAPHAAPAPGRATAGHPPPADPASATSPAAAAAAAAPPAPADRGDALVIDLARQPAVSRPPLRRRAAVLAAAAAVVTVAAVSGVTLATGGSPEDAADVQSDQGAGLPSAPPASGGAEGPGAPLADEDLAALAHVPTIATDLDGWGVVYVDAPTAGEGDLTLSDVDGPGTVGSVPAGTPGRLDIRWAAGEEYDAWVADAEQGLGAGVATTVAGQPALTFSYEQTAPAGPGIATTDDPPDAGAGEEAGPAAGTSYMTVWRLGDHALQATGTFASPADHDALLASLVVEPPEVWAASLPADAILPSQRAATVDAMLADVPTPTGFDAGPLRSQPAAVHDRYQVGAHVTGAVACAWIESWVAASAAGDTAAVQAAVDAMATSHDWDVLVGMTDDGDWAEVLWEYADALPTDGPVSGGRPLTVTESYANALGC
jgi:hypothetical protein